MNLEQIQAIINLSLTTGLFFVEVAQLMKNKMPKGKKKRGVTLLEILVAMVVLTGGLFMVFNIFPKGFAASYRSKNQTIATQLAQGRLEEIIQNKEPADCRGGSNCLYRMPRVISEPETGISFDPLTSGMGTNCDQLYVNPGDYGVSGSTRMGTLCTFHMGVVDDYSSWEQFSENPWFWFHVQVTPVLDRSSNYPAFDPNDNTNRKTLYRDYGSCSRVTVRVRGPIDNITNWDTVMTAGGGRLPAEVVLSTYVANKYLASTLIDTGGTNSTFALSPAGPHGVWNDPSKAHWIIVDDIRNFTIFNTLRQAEKTPSWLFHVNSAGVLPVNEISTQQARLYGNTAGYGDRTAPPRYPDNPDSTSLSYNYGWGQNYRHNVGNNKSLDNVVIVRRDSVSGGFETGTDRLLIQTNKIVTINPSNNGVCLQQPLYFDKIPEHSMLKILQADAPPGGVDQGGPVDPPPPDTGSMPVQQIYANRRFGLFTDSNANPNMGAFPWPAYQMNYSGTREPTPDQQHIPYAFPYPGNRGISPAPPDFGYTVVNTNRPVRYELMQYVTIPRQAGGNIEVY